MNKRTHAIVDGAGITVLLFAGSVLMLLVSELVRDALHPNQWNQWRNRWH